MKKLLLTLTFVSTLSLSAQTDTETSSDSTDNGFNKWSLELNGGVNKPSAPFAPGYFAATPSFFNVDFGARYMFNNKFGVKFDVAYYKLQDNESSMPFNTKYYRADIQGVANIGRIMNFETWTKRIGALIHLGGGYMQFRSDNLDYTDRGGNFIVGITGQYKLAKRVVLTGDFTSVTNVSQDKTFDGTSGTGQLRGFSGGIFSGTIGLTVYLGSHDEHADWYVDTNKNDEELDALKKRLADMETYTADTDKDGVMDGLDAEPNSKPGLAVDSKGRTVDLNGNGIPDELESYMQKTYGDSNKGGSNVTNVQNNSALVKALINDGYVTCYYDYNKSTPTNVSTEGIDFILTYLRNNPTATVDIIGHADEIGKTPYNEKLSQARANNVKSILMKAKIDPSRLNVVAAGEDDSVDKDSAGARKLVRRVTFKVK